MCMVMLMAMSTAMQAMDNACAHTAAHVLTYDDVYGEYDAVPLPELAECNSH